MKKPYDNQKQLRRDVRAPKRKDKTPKPRCNARVTHGWHDYQCERNVITERADMAGQMHPLCKQHATKYDEPNVMTNGRENNGPRACSYWWKW